MLIIRELAHGSTYDAEQRVETTARTLSGASSWRLTKIAIDVAGEAYVDVKRHMKAALTSYRREAVIFDSGTSYH
jgi:hypothetical protein